MMRVLLIAALLAWVTGCDARPDQVVIVVDTKGRPIENARVQYNAASAPDNPIAFTDRKGVARNPNRHFGPSYITVSKAGYDREESNVGPKVWPLTITLQTTHGK